jgi:hypothetical protein
MSDTVLLGTPQTIQERIAAARAHQAEIEAAQRKEANQPQLVQFTFLVDKLFGSAARTDLKARVEWHDRPTLVIPWQGKELLLVALPKPTGHVGWTVGAVELFEQKYAPGPDTALDLLLVALDAA